MSDDHKIMKNSTGLEINERLREIRNALSGSGHTGTIYGFHVDSTESDPSAAVTYLADARGMTPAYMDFTNGVFNYGSWQDAFFMPRPCMLNYNGTVAYYLNPNDYTLKEDGSASDVANDAFAGNAMIEWGQNGKKIWYKIIPDSTPTSASIFVADYQVDSGYHAWSFINNQGSYVDHFYTPIYNGWKDSSNRIRSISGKTPTASDTATNERTYCRNNNTSYAIWDTEVYCDNILINILLTLMGKSLDSQSVFGQGVTSGSQSGVKNTGLGNSLGMFFGYSNTTSVVKVFGMENYWGNLWRRFGGLVNDKGTAYYKLTRGTQDGSSATDYIVSDTTGAYSGYLTGGTVPTASNVYIHTMTFDSNQWSPTVVDGSSSTYYCDAFWSNNNQVDYALRGGTSLYGSSCGAWALALSGTSSSADWSLAAAPSCKPLF